MSERKYPCVATAIKHRAGEIYTSACPFGVMATSLDEASGRAARVARKLYPREAGWEKVNSGAIEPDAVLDPDGEIEAVEPEW